MHIAFDKICMSGAKFAKFAISQNSHEMHINEVGMTCMLDLDRSHCAVSVRIVIIESADGVLLTRDALYPGLSGNQIFDNFGQGHSAAVAHKVTRQDANGQTCLS